MKEPQKLTMAELDKISAAETGALARNIYLDPDVALLKTQVETVLNSLTNQERKLLQLRFGLQDGKSRTIEQVAAEMGITREKVRKLETRGLQKLRHPSKSRKISKLVSSTSDAEIKEGLE